MSESEPADTRERLIESMRELLRDRGYDGTSPTAIWRGANTGQGSLYHHFKGKLDIALEAERRSAQIVQAQARQTLDVPGSAFGRIRDYLLKERDALRGCHIGNLAADPEIMANDELREPVRETFAVQRALLASAIEEGKAAGEFHPDLDAQQASSALLAAIIGAYSLARAEQSGEAFHEAVHGALNLLKQSN